MDRYFICIIMLYNYILRVVFLKNYLRILSILYTNYRLLKDSKTFLVLRDLYRILAIVSWRLVMAHFGYSY